MMDEIDRIFSTTNIRIATWLMTNDINCIGVKWKKEKDRDRCYWIFNEFDDIDELINDFFDANIGFINKSKDKEIKLTKFIDSFSKAKDMMYASHKVE